MLGHQNFAFADVVGGAHQPLIFHLFDQPRGLVIADRQFALDIRGRTFAVPDHDLHRLIIKRILAIGIAAKAKDQIDIAFAVIVGPSVTPLIYSGGRSS